MPNKGELNQLNKLLIYHRCNKFMLIQNYVPEKVFILKYYKKIIRNIVSPKSWPSRRLVHLILVKIKKKE